MLNSKKNQAKSSLVIDEFKDHGQLLQSEQLRRTVNSIKHIHSLQLLLSKSDDKALNSWKQLQDLLTQTSSANERDDSYEYVLLRHCPLHLLMHPAFVQYFVRFGQVYVQSVGTSIDEQTALTLGPDGVLHLSIDESLYRSVGLIGHQSAQYAKQNLIPKKLIRIDLKDSKYESFDGRAFQKTFITLRNSHLKLDLVMKWTAPVDSQLSARSLYKLFRLFKDNNSAEPNVGQFLMEEADRQQMQVLLCAPKVRRYTAYSVRVPLTPDWSEVVARGRLDERDIADSRLMQLIDTFGGALAGVNFDADEEVSGWPGSTAYEYQDFVCYEITGLFSETDVDQVLQRLRSRLNATEDSVERFVMIVNGFENGVVTWYEKNCEHGKSLSGECLYGIMAQSNAYSFVWRQADQFSFGIEKL